MRCLILEEKVRFLQNSEGNYHFKELFTGMDLEEETKEKVIKQLDIICEYEKRINTHPNVELMYSSLFIEL